MFQLKSISSEYFTIHERCEKALNKSAICICYLGKMEGLIRGQTMTYDMEMLSVLPALCEPMML